MSTVRFSKDEEFLFRILDELKDGRSYTIRELAAILELSTYTRVLPNHPVFIQLVKNRIFIKSNGSNQNEPDSYEFNLKRCKKWMSETEMWKRWKTIMGVRLSDWG